mgnify:CR=1 FL=1
MNIGLPNINQVMPLAKMCITNKATKKKIYVMYNPETYVQERGTKYSETPGLASNMPSIQFVHGMGETLQMELFFDTYSAGSLMVGGSLTDKAKLLATAALPAPVKLDVRKFTSKIYDLMLINASTHVPPLLKIEWSSLQFEGHLVNCSQKFTMFNQLGTPVRATLNVTFKQYVKPSKIASLKPNESPDTAKYRLVHQGDSLWELSGKEYGQCEAWRAIASANGIDNPRLLETGKMLKLPALK